MADARKKKRCSAKRVTEFRNPLEATSEKLVELRLANSPRHAKTQPNLYSVPSVQTYWMQGQPTYDPGLIRCPVQIVVGEWDRETSPAQGLQVFDRLRGTSTRRYTVIGAATHSMLLETQRHQLYDVAATFLAE